MSFSFNPSPQPSPSSKPPAPVPHVVIVTGSHLAAELCDRPQAYRLRERIVTRLRDEEMDRPELRVVVCSDVWYLNQDHLRTLPTISVGGPAVSALAAYLADRLPSVFAVDGVMIVQMDENAGIPMASIWGIDAPSTASAVDTFLDKFLDQFLDAAAAPQ
jgi:hypothetical protein